MPGDAGRVDWTTRRRMIESFADFPGLSAIAPRQRQVPPGQIDAARIAKHNLVAVHRIKVASRTVEGNHEFDLEMQALGQGRVGDDATVRNPKSIGRLGEEKG